MKYLLMMNTMKAGQTPFPGWSREDIQRHITFMMGLYKELAGSGELVVAEGLSSPDEATLVRADEDGMPITDGVFPEGKEFLAGFWIIEVSNAQRAFQIAAKASAAPGANAAPLNMPIEVRRVLSGPPQV